MHKPPEKVRGVYERQPGSGVWWIRYADQHGLEHREKIGPRGLAVAAYRKRKTEVQERRFFPEKFRRRNVLLKTAIADTLKRNKDKATIKDMRRYGQVWTERLGDRTLESITWGDAERFAVERRTAVSAQTVAHELTFLRTVFTMAVQDGLIDRNPLSGKVKAPKSERLRYLTDAEETALLAALTAPLSQDLVLFAIHTGLRQAEQFGLKWPWTDLANNVLRIPRSKNDAPRTVPLNDTAKAILQRQPHRLRCPWVWPTTSRKGGATPGARHLSAGNFYKRVFVPAVKAAGIEDFHWHDLRHTFASRLAMNGTDIRTIAELLGHKKIAMAMRYAHLSAAHQLDAVRKLNGSAKGPTGTATGTEGNRA
jgi:integrase